MRYKHLKSCFSLRQIRQSPACGYCRDAANRNAAFGSTDSEGSALWIRAFSCAGNIGRPGTPRATVCKVSKYSTFGIKVQYRVHGWAHLIS